MLNSRAPHLGGMNGDVQSDLATLAFKNGEQLEDFHSRILRLQQEIMLSREIVSPTRILFQYMKALKNSKKLRGLIAPKIKNLITLLDKKRKSDVFMVGDINDIYCYLEMIGDPTTLTTSAQIYHHFRPSSSSNNDSATLQPVITALCIRQRIIFE